MRPMLVAAALAVFAFAQPVAAQQPEPSVAQVQALIADTGAWTLEYQAILAQATQPLEDMNTYSAILERFIAGESDAGVAGAELEAWRARGLSAFAAARATASTLREPPSMVILGSAGERLEAALRTGRDNIVPTINEMERVLNAAVDMGVAALRDPEKSFEARQRAWYSATIQLVRVDRLRVNAQAAGLSSDHPNHALMQATLHYYDSLVAVPVYALEELDGGGDRAALVAALRASANRMRGELDRATTLTAAVVQRARAMQIGETADLARTLLSALDTYPASIRAYHGLADGVDEAANALERGQDVTEVWADQETSDIPHLTEIDRLERLRASQMANIHGTL